MKSPDEIISEIMGAYPESEWLKVCRAALPDISDGEIASIIEVMSGGDVVVIDEAIADEEKARARERQGSRTDLEPSGHLAVGSTGESRDIIAKKAGFSSEGSEVDGQFSNTGKPEAEA